MKSSPPPPPAQGSEDGEDGNPKLFSSNFLLAIGVNLCLGMIFFMLITGMATFAVVEFSAGQTSAGLAASAFVVGALFARIFAGKYVDFLGRRRSVLVCLVIYTLAMVAYLAVDSFAVLIVIRLIHGATFGFGHTALNAGVFAMIPAARRGEGAGYYLIANSLPQALGPLLGLQVSQAFGFQALFIAASVLSLASLLLALWMHLPESPPARQRLRDHLKLKPSDVLDRRALPIALIAMMLAMGFASVMMFLDSFSRVENMTNVASMYFVVFAIVVLFTRLFVGRLHDHYGDNAVIYPAIVMYSGAMALLAWSPTELVVLASAVLAGLGHGTLVPVLQATISSIVPAHRLSIGLSTFAIMSDVGTGVAPFFLGPLAEAGGYRVMYAACACLIVVAFVTYWILHGRYDVHQGRRRRPRS